MPKDIGRDARLSRQDVTKLACLPCKERKSKCDRKEPCSSCILRDTQRQCYATEVKIRPLNIAEQRLRKKQRTLSSSSEERGVSEDGTEDLGDATSARCTTISSAASKEAIRSPTVVAHASSYIQDLLGTIENLKSTTESLQHCVRNDFLGDRRDALDFVSEDISWDEFSHVMPPKKDCEAILRVFFSNACWQNHLVNQYHFEEGWMKLQSGKKVHRRFAALVLAMVALSLHVTPDHQADMRFKSKTWGRSLCLFAHRLLLYREADPFQETIIDMEDLQARCLLGTFMSLSGWVEQTWLLVGKTIRLGKVINLFDEKKWPMQDLSDWDVEIRRRIAWDLISKDRWLSCHSSRMADLPLDHQVNQSKLYSTTCYDPVTGRERLLGAPTLVSHYSHEMSRALVSRGAMRVNLFLSSVQHLLPMDRCLQARELDAYLANLEVKDVTWDIKYPEACNTATLHHPDDYQKACQSIIYYTGLKRLRCTVMRHFLRDRSTPIEFQIAALEHARKLIESVPILITLSSSPLVMFSSSWCSDHLFLAASTFARICLEEGGSNNGQTNLDDLDWFASKISEVVDAFAILGKKDRVARRCQDLLTALCVEKPWLQSRIAAHRNGKIHATMPSLIDNAHGNDEANGVDGKVTSEAAPVNFIPSEQYDQSRDSKMRNSQPSSSSGPRLESNIVEEDLDSKLAGWDSWHLLSDEDWATVLKSLQ